LADGRVDVNCALPSGLTPLISACCQLEQAIDQIGAPELPTRCLVLLLKSRRISDYHMKESIALIRQKFMPTPRQIAKVDADGEPLPGYLPMTGKQKMALLVMPVLEAELQGEHRWCAYCLKLTPDRDLDKCARCDQVSYCPPLNRPQLEGGYYSSGMSTEEIERRQKEIADCQRLHWKAEHKHDCARFKAEAAAAKEAEEKVATEHEVDRRVLGDDNDAAARPAWEKALGGVRRVCGCCCWCGDVEEEKEKKQLCCKDTY
jgi:hypothetical protein